MKLEQRVKKDKNTDQHRLKASLLNMLTSATFQTLLGIFSFIERTIFLRTLGVELNGLNALFQTILTVLSISELGISSAIAFSLYKPLAEDDKCAIYTYMSVFRKAYYIIGSFIIIVGLLLSPFIRFFAKSDVPIDNIQIYFIIYLLGVGLSYFNSYKAILIEADQKKYITNICTYSGSALQCILQICVLLFTKSYILYLLVFFVMNISKNVIISIITTKQYPFLKNHDYKKAKLGKADWRKLTTNIRALFMHKLGETTIASTDNILISYLLNLSVMGIYANYKMIIDSLYGAMRVFASSIQASIGNICATESNDKIYDSFNYLNFINYLLFSFTAATFAIIIQPIMSLWFGQKYLLDYTTVILLALSFFFTGMRRIVMNYHDAFGLFWVDRFKPIAEALANLIVSYFLAKRIGINGIFIGTIFSSVLIGTSIEMYVVFHDGFNRKVSNYLFTYIKYTISFIIVTSVTYFIVMIFSATSLLQVIMLVILTMLLLIVFISLIHIRNPYMKTIRGIAIKFVRNKLRIE